MTMKKFEDVALVTNIFLVCVVLDFQAICDCVLFDVTASIRRSDMSIRFEWPWCRTKIDSSPVHQS